MLQSILPSDRHLVETGTSILADAFELGGALGGVLDYVGADV